MSPYQLPLVPAVGMLFHGCPKCGGALDRPDAAGDRSCVQCGFVLYAPAVRYGCRKDVAA